MTDDQAIAKLLAVLRGEEDPRFAPLLVDEFEKDLEESGNAAEATLDALVAAGADRAVALDLLMHAQRCGQNAQSIALLKAAFAATKPVGEA